MSSVNAQTEPSEQDPLAIRNAASMMHWTQTRWFLPVAILLLTTVAFLPVICAPGQTVSFTGLDGSAYFEFARQYGFREMRAGHLALWCPYIFCGEPFLGNWQSALFYPPNWIYLFLPVGMAMNCEAFFSTAICALGMGLWAQRTGVGPLPALAAGAAAAFGAPYTLHLFAGHFSMIDALAWTPWLFLAWENLLARPSLRWALAGSAALALQVLAGHPQSVYGTIIVSAIYLLLRLLHAKERARTILCAVGIGVASACLCAAQIDAGLASKAEGLRQASMSYAYSTTYSLTPASFATLFAPKFFGDEGAGHPYWGPSLMWETSAYVGACIVALALFRLVNRGDRRSRVWGIAALICVVLSMAGHTPLFQFLYRSVPGLDEFRAQGRFFYFAGLFLALLAAHALEQLRRGEFDARFAALFFGLAAACLATGIGGYCENLVVRPAESQIAAAFFLNSAQVALASHFAANGLLVSGVLLAVLGVMTLLAKRSAKAAEIACVLAIAELVCYAGSTMVTFNTQAMQMPQSIAQFLQANPGDYRISDECAPADSAMTARVNEVAGYDPAWLARVQQFLDYTEKTGAGAPSPMLRLVRLTYGFVPGQGGAIAQLNFPNPLPHAFCAPSWIVAAGMGNILDAVSRITPASPALPEVVLETPPGIAAPSVPGPPASVTATMDEVGTIDITADTTQPELIAVTDPYSRYWSASALPGSSQSTYHVVPCDWAIMAIPVGAGHHAIELRYLPAGFAASLALMGFSWAVWIALALRCRGRTFEDPSANVSAEASVQ